MADLYVDRTAWLLAVCLCCGCSKEGPIGPNGCPLNPASPPLPVPVPRGESSPSPTQSTTPSMRTPHPTADEVASTITGAYRNSSLSTFTVVEDRADALRLDRAWRMDVQHWTRQFDGVDMVGSGAVTVWWNERWITDWHRELHEPAPVRRSAVISDARARTNAGVAPGDAEVKTRLVYFSIFKELSKVPHPTNAMDVEIVVDCYRLTIEVTGRGPDRSRTYVDAYNGDIVHRIAHSGWIN